MMPQRAGQAAKRRSPRGLKWPGETSSDLARSIGAARASPGPCRPATSKPLHQSHYCDTIAMSVTQVRFFEELDGRAPVLEWLKELKQRDASAFAKCVAAIERLRMLGHELRRPCADYLRDGIHELRLRKGRVHYRILYFFHGRGVAVLAVALTKEGAVPEQGIERALRRKREFETNPDRHIHRE